MEIQYDLHLHSDFSTDSDTPMETMIREAIRRGMKGICFTEHMDMDYPPPYEGFEVDLPAYLAQITRLRELYRPQIDVRIGLELGMQPHLAPRYRELLVGLPLDFVIASQHLVGRIDPYYPEIWETRSEQEVYRAYFEELLSNLKTMDDYDTIAHLDYIVRYGPNQNRFYSYEAYADCIDPILEHVITREKCLEVNTAGLKYGLGHPNPEESVLKRYRLLGGKRITLGSDAHRPEHIAWDFDTAAAILRELGFSHYTVFKNRVPQEIPL